MPPGCKDLIDVLDRPEGRYEEAARQLASRFLRLESGSSEVVRRFIRGFVLMLLHDAQKDRATEVVIDVAWPNGGTPVRCRVDETWREMSSFPAEFRPHVMAELLRMAKLSVEQIPGEGVLNVSVGDVRLRWVVAMMSVDGECILSCVQEREAAGES